MNMLIIIQKYPSTQLEIIPVVKIFIKSLIANPTNLYPRNAANSKMAVERDSK